MHHDDPWVQEAAEFAAQCKTGWSESNGEQLNLSSSLLTDASFLIAGYWQHAHGDWRQKHDRQSS